MASPAPPKTAPVALPAWSALRRAPDLQTIPALTQPSSSVDENLIVFSTQSRTVYEALVDHGSVTGPDWGSVHPSFEPAYRWMASRVAFHRAASRPSTHERICGLRAPLWGWVHSPGRLTPPPLKPTPTGHRSEVLLALSIPCTEAVVSAHEAWHHVLNQTWCPAPNHNGLDADEARAYESFLDEVDTALGHTQWTLDDLPVAMRRKVEGSWRWSLIPALYPHSPIQAATASFEADWVVGAWRMN